MILDQFQQKLKIAHLHLNYFYLKYFELRKLEVSNQSLFAAEDETDFGHHRSVFADNASTVRTDDEDVNEESSVITRAKKSLTILLQ